MYAGPIRIPDAIEPIAGYRMWSFVLPGQGGGLHSLTCPGPGGCPWEDAGSSWVLASCERDYVREHDAPYETCTCGVYAVPTLIDIARGARGLIGVGDDIVVGRVDLAGKIIVHDHGFRAERARIVELVPLEGATADVMGLAARLSIPIVPVAPELSAERPPPIEFDILRRVSEGATNGEVAYSLGISPAQVRRHLEQILGILGANDRAQALAFVPPPDAAA